MDYIQVYLTTEKYNATRGKRQKLMRTIFVLGASKLQIPAIKKAKEKGLFVYVLDYDPDAIGIRYADKFLEISTIDKKAVYEAAIKYKPDFIITSTSDMPVRTVSWVNEKLGKPNNISYAGSIWATDKIAMRNRMKECGVPIPEYYEVADIKEFLAIVDGMSECFIIKPSDNSASRGVVLIDKSKKPNYEELYNYSLQYSRNGKIIVEEYMEGPEVSVESYTIDGKSHIITITDKEVTEPPYFVEIGHTQPSQLSIKKQREIKKVTEEAIRAIGITNGPSHTELKVTSSRVKLIEIAARLGGDYIASKLVPLSTGIDMIECSYATLFGEKVNYKSTLSRGAAIRFIESKNKRGILASVKGIDEAKKMQGIQEVEVYVNPGEHLKELENSNDRIGHVISIGKDAAEAAKNAENALDVIHVLIE